MGKSLTKHPDQVRRRQRLILFCKEIKRALLSMCVDHGITIKNIDYFMEEFYMAMEYHELEYETETLLQMLLDEGFLRHTFEKYCETP
jgi:hypothetical protein